MLSVLSTAQRSSIDRMSRDFATASPGYAGGLPQFIDDILFTLAQGTFGITSLAADVDSMCLNGGAFTIDTGTTSGLTFAHLGGRINLGTTVMNVAAASVALTASATNYIEIDSSGTMHATGGGFTAGRTPVYVAVTSSSAITSITSAKAFLTCLTAITGAQLSSAAASKVVSKGVGTLTATTTYILRAPCTGTLSAAGFISQTAVTQSDANYWSVSSIDVGAAGVGTQALLAATAANTTKATGGAAVAVLTPFPLSLSGTVSVTEGDVITVTFTATGAPAALTGSELWMKFAFAN